MFYAGHEIAVHTQRHPSLLGLDQPQLVKELVGARSKLAQCGVPEVRGRGTRTGSPRSSCRQCLAGGRAQWQRWQQQAQAQQPEGTWPGMAAGGRRQ